MSDTQISFDDDVPQWIEEYALLWANRFRLFDWNIKVQMDRVIDGDEGVDGRAEWNIRTSEALVRFCTHLENNLKGRVVVIHEFLHLKHGMVDSWVSDHVIDKLPHDAQAVAEDAYAMTMEQSHHSMANLLYRLTVEQDFPDEDPSDRLDPYLKVSPAKRTDRRK